MIIIPNVNKENSCLDCLVWSLCWDNKPTEDISEDRCPIVEFEGVELFYDDMPTIEAEPIKHGRWLKNGSRYCECSVCHHEGNISGQDNYCWYCGAKMDEVEE